jgi:hypothetical protein
MVGVSPKCTSQYPRVGPAIPAPDIKTFTGIGMRASYRESRRTMQGLIQTPSSVSIAWLELPYLCAAAEACYNFESTCCARFFSTAFSWSADRSLLYTDSLNAVLPFRTASPPTR